MALYRAIALSLLLLIFSNSTLLANQADGRSLGMVVTLPEEGDFESALDLALDAGVTRVPVTFFWRTLEPEPRVYDDRNLALAALMLPAMGLSIDLAITPVAGNELVMPRDLMGKSLDDPEVISRYLELLDHVLTVLGTTDVRVLLVGVEVDVLLGDDQAAWDSYAAFASAASAFVHSVRPGIDVGVQSSTYSRLLDPERWTALDAVSDFIATSYYPLDALMARDPSEVASDFDTLTALYPDRTIRIVEAGFPSSRSNGSSAKVQAQFIHALFAAWDDHANQILSITLSTEHDYSPHDLEQIEHASGDSHSRYASFLGSIGLREWEDDGAPKLAWDALLQETEARGWRP